MLRKKEKGVVLLAVIIIALILSIIGFGALFVAQQEGVQGRMDTDKTRAFYLAEAGLAKMQERLQLPLTGGINELLDETLEEALPQGTFSVQVIENDGNYYAVSTGTRGRIEKELRTKINFLAIPLESAIYATNQGGGSWACQLRGKGNPSTAGKGEQGGKDQVFGDVYVDGDVFMYQESFVKPSLAPNRWNLMGDVSATGTINVLDSASIAGSKHPSAKKPESVNLKAMDYANNNTHNVSQIFAGITSGYLPSGHELRDVFVKNPSDRKKECAETPNDDYFLEPIAVSGGGSDKDARTPLHLGNKRIYYVDGDVWVHSLSTYGFLVDGQATVVATGNIHICDNIKYADSNSMLGLVALGKYDITGKLVSGGNIYFGDPRYGTMYIVSAMMFAADDFLYNHDTVAQHAAEPTTGFTVIGNFAAMDKVVVERDWYTKDGGKGTATKMAAAARFNPAAGQWVDVDTEKALTSSEISSLRHYQMIVYYDDRVRSIDTQPPGLPQGTSVIFAGFSNWEEP
jgi:hypothetical protein